VRSHAQLNVVLDQIAQQCPDGAESLKLVEYQPDDLLDLLIGVKANFSGGRIEIACGQAAAEFTALGLVEGALMEALFEGMEFGLTHGALQAQQQAIVIVAGVVNAIEVADEGFEECTDFEELMPVLGRSSEPGDIETENQSDMIQAHFGHELLEPESALDGRGGLAEVFINHENAIARPAQGKGAIDKAVLQAGRFLVLDHLLHGGLADIDDG
jgi:hypothetical protein